MNGLSRDISNYYLSIEKSVYFANPLGGLKIYAILY